MKALNVSEPAEIEFREVTAWYRDRDERVATRFITETRRILDLVQRFPSIGGVVPGVDDMHVRKMPLHGFPYYIVFVNLTDRVEVVAVAHNRRRPGYFIDRISRL